MKIRVFQFELELTHQWAIAGSVAKKTRMVTMVELMSSDGITGIGECAPSDRYGETHGTVADFLQKVDAKRLSFDDVQGSMAYLESIAPKNFAAKCPVNIALMDGAGKKAGKPIYDLLGLGFTENKHITSYTIGIDTPDII